MVGQPARAHLDPDGRQVVTIVVRGGYRPHSIIARAGIPLRLVFRRDDDDVCTERVVFSNPRLARYLNPAGVTTIDLPAQPPGEVRFTCGMGRYRGRIEFVDDRVPSVFGALRRGLHYPPKPVGLLLALSLAVILLVMVLASLTFDLRVAIAVASMGLIAWLAIWLWMIGDSVTSR